MMAQGAMMAQSAMMAQGAKMAQRKEAGLHQLPTTARPIPLL